MTTAPPSAAEVHTARDVLIHLPALVHLTRTQRGQSLRAAAAQIGTTHVHLMRIEAGSTEPKLHTIWAMLEYLVPNGDH